MTRQLCVLLRSTISPNRSYGLRRILALFACWLLTVAALPAQLGQITLDPQNGLVQQWTVSVTVLTGQLVKEDANRRVLPVALSDTSGAIGVAITGAVSPFQSIIVSKLGDVQLLVDGPCNPGQNVFISNAQVARGTCIANSNQVLGIALAGTSRAGYATVFLNIQATKQAVGAEPLSALRWNDNNQFAVASGLETDGSGYYAKGPAPWTDARAFGIRASNGPASTTATCSNNSNVLTTAGGGFIVGDGITIENCGRTNTLFTPGTPTVMPVVLTGGARTHNVTNGPTASSSYSYCVFAEDQGQGLTPCSPITTIANGQATLGLNTISVTSITRSKDVMTINFSSDRRFPALMAFELSTSAPGDYSGWFNVCANEGANNFVTACSLTNDTRASGTFPADVDSGGTGTLSYYQATRVKWTAVPGAVRYYICVQRPGDPSLHLTGATMLNYVGNGYQDVEFEDLGTTQEGNQTFPDYVSNSSCSGSRTNDSLTTTITAVGSGTYSIAANASQNARERMVTLDACPALQAAANQAANGNGTVYIPPTLSVLNSYRIVSYCRIIGPLNVKQAAPITIGDVLETSGGTNWDGMWSAIGTPQFGTNSAVPILGAWTTSTFHVTGLSNTFTFLNFTNNNNAVNLVTTDNTWSQFLFCNFQTFDTSPNDYLGMAIVYRDTTGTITDQSIEHSSITGGPDQINDKSWTPLVWIAPGQNGSGGPNGSGISLILKTVNFSRRSIETTGGYLYANWIYEQGAIMPEFLLDSGNPLGGGYTFDHLFHDTTGEPFIASLSACGPSCPTGLFDVGYVVGGNPGMLFSGSRPYAASVRIYGADQNGTQTLPNRGMNDLGQYNYVGYPYDIGGSLSPHNQPLSVSSIPQSHLGGVEEFWPLLPPATPVSGAPAGGGKMPSGTWIYTVSATGYDGGETIVQQTPSRPQVTSGTCPGSGKCQIPLTLAQEVGAPGGLNIHRCDTAVNSCTGFAGIVNPGGGWVRVASHVTETSYLDDNAGGTTGITSTATATGSSFHNDQTVGSNTAWRVPRRFSTLAACTKAIEGTVATVTDSTANAWGTAIVGGGANVVLAFCDGANWTVYGK